MPGDMKLKSQRYKLDTIVMVVAYGMYRSMFGLFYGEGICGFEASAGCFTLLSPTQIASRPGKPVKRVPFPFAPRLQLNAKYQSSNLGAGRASPDTLYPENRN